MNVEVQGTIADVAAFAKQLRTGIWLGEYHHWSVPHLLRWLGNMARAMGSTPPKLQDELTSDIEWSLRQADADQATRVQNAILALDGFIVWCDAEIAVQTGDRQRSDHYRAWHQLVAETCGKQVLPTVTEQDAAILKAYLQAHPRLLTIAALESQLAKMHNELDTKTVSTRNKYLLSVELISRPNGERKGAQLTELGQELANRLDAA